MQLKMCKFTTPSKLTLTQGQVRTKKTDKPREPRPGEGKPDRRQTGGCWWPGPQLAGFPHGNHFKNAHVEGQARSRGTMMEPSQSLSQITLQKHSNKQQQKHRPRDRTQDPETSPRSYTYLTFHRCQSRH